MENIIQTNECADHDIDNEYINSLETFVIEYPLNYEEIVNRKLRILELEYEETIKCEIKIKCENQEILEKVEEKSEKTEEIEYMKISSSGGCVYEFMDDDEGFVDVEEEEGEELKEQENEHEFESELKRDDLIEGLEFVNNQEDTETKEDDSKLKIERDFIPVKDPEKIKNAMKSFTMKPPRWAENLNDDDFLKIVKNAMMNKNFIKNNLN